MKTGKNKNKCDFITAETERHLLLLSWSGARRKGLLWGTAGPALIPLHHPGLTLGGPEFGGIWSLLGFRRDRGVAGWAGGALCVRLGLQRHWWTPAGSYSHTTPSGSTESFIYISLEWFTFDHLTGFILASSDIFFHVGLFHTLHFPDVAVSCDDPCCTTCPYLYY